MARIFNFGISSVISAIQFAAMAFLIICCVTAPVFKQIGIAKTNDVVFGTFGYCESDKCSSAAANYHPELLASSETWKVSSSARGKLGNILIVMPVAAGLTFFAIMSNFVSQFGSISASGASFVVNLLLSILAFAASALMCVVTFLLFYPKVTWCSWLLIPAAVINLACVPLTYVAHSLAPRMDTDEEGSEMNKGFGHDVTRLDQDPVYDRYSMNNYNENPEGTKADKPAYPEFYKGPQIVTSTTLNSATTDSRSDREAFIRDKQSLSADPQDHQSQLVAPGKEAPVNDFSFENTSNETKPYSAIAGPYGEPRSGTEDSIPKAFPALPHMNRGPSNTSSFYSERANGISRQGTLNTTDLRPSSALNLQTVKDEKPNQEELQKIINGAIREEEDEEFIKQQTIDPSERPHLDDDDGIKDDDSDFTSVSQRGINPNYMQFTTGPRIGHQPHQAKTMSNMRGPVNQPGVPLAGAPSHTYHMVPSHAQRAYVPQPKEVATRQNYQPYSAHQPLQGTHAAHRQNFHPYSIQQPPQGPIPAAFPRAQHPAPNLRGNSDAVLNTNPDFMVSDVATARRPGVGRPQQGMYAPPPQSATSPIYRPAYKKRLPKQNMPAASMARDGPYSGMM